MTKAVTRWKRIPEKLLRCRWDLGPDCLARGCIALRSIYVEPGSEGDRGGVPICEYCGQDRVYAQTQIRQAT